MQWEWNTTDLFQPYLEILLVRAIVQCVCVMSHKVEFLIWLGDVAERTNLTESNLYSLSSILGEINQALRNGWAWACAPCWALPPCRHILEVCSASLLCQRRESLPCLRDFRLSNTTNTFPLTDHFWEFTGEVVRGDFTPLTCGFAVIVWKELSPDSCRISSECLCPSDLAGMRVLFPGMVQWMSFHAPALVCIKLCPEATNSLETHLVAGTVPESGKLVVFFPEVIIIRKE